MSNDEIFGNINKYLSNWMMNSIFLMKTLEVVRLTLIWISN